MTDLIPWRGGELSRLRGEIDNLFDRFFEGLPWAGFSTRMEATPFVDLSETKEDIIVRAEIAGIDIKDIDISLIGDVLSIKGEKKQEKEEKDENAHRIERSYGAFARSIRLPCEVEPDKIMATYKRGVLKIRLPKCEASKAKSIKISVK